MLSPSNVILDALADLLAADTGTLASAAALKVKLAANSFTPGHDLLVGAFTAATFTGSADLSPTIGAQTVYVDPIDGKRTIELIEPVGGWHWDCTVDPTPAETIYGYYVTNNAGTVLLGCELFPVPVLIDAAGQGLDVPFVRLKLDEDAMG